MRIAVFSLGPLFPRQVHGGSQRTLEAVVRHLAECGHTVSVYCTRRDGNSDAFSLAPGATVFPVLRFKPTYPEPYEAAPHELVELVGTLGRAAVEHDRFYVHDGELLYHFIYEQVPAVVSFQDLLYPTTLAGALSFRRDHLVLSSDYVRDCVFQLFERFRPLPDDMVSVVPNGFDLDALRPVRSDALRAELGLAEDALPVLYPHRPDPRKGVFESLGALLRTLEQLPPERAARVRMLIPTWMDAGLDSDGARSYRDTYAQVERAAAEAGWPHLVHLHPWIDSARMGEYYSLGKVVLSIGTFIEAFGNSSVEAQLCGTPAVISRVGAQRTVLPEHLVRKVDYGDEARVAELLGAALSGEALYPEEEFRSYVDEHYSFSQMGRGYAAAILNARLRTQLPPFTLPTDSPERVRVPAWCAALESGYYNDYAYGYIDDPLLEKVAARLGSGSARVTDFQSLAGTQRIETWIRDGHLATEGRR